MSDIVLNGELVQIEPDMEAIMKITHTGVTKHFILQYVFIPASLPKFSPSITSLRLPKVNAL